jgi:hypothetical protein
VIDDQDKLLILEDFHSDGDLPKFRKEQVATYVSRGRIFTPVNGDAMVPRVRGAMLRLWQWIVDLFCRRGDVPSFFKAVEQANRTIEEAPSREEGYKRAIAIAESSGQKALLGQLKDGLAAHQAEQKLRRVWACATYVSESDVVRFYKISKRGLRLDWIRNFTRQIPEAVLERKVLADVHHIFDNYVVLHYDPDGKSYRESEEEKAARRDPILFGVMKGQRKLYFVGDWKDEVCDLTLEEVADTLGSHVIREVNPEPEP